MKKQPSLTPLIIAVGAISFGLSAPSQATALFSTDFEADVVGATTAADPSDVGGFRGNFEAAIVRDSSSVAPFGADNQYLQFGGSGVSSFIDPNYSARGIVTGAASSSYTATVVGISFKYFETTPNSWGTHIGVGTGANPWQPDLNGTGGLFALSFDDGVIGLGNNTTTASGTLPSYTKGQAYEITYFMNWTGASETVTGANGDEVTLANKQIGFWMTDLETDTISSTVILSSSFGDAAASISPVFRNFNTSEANQNVVYLDDISIAVIPEPSTWALILGLAVLVPVGVARHRRNRKIA